MDAFDMMDVVQMLGYLQNIDRSLERIANALDPNTGGAAEVHLVDYQPAEHIYYEVVPSA